MKVSHTSIVTIMLTTGIFALIYSFSWAQTAPAAFLSTGSISDFTADVKLGLNALSVNSFAQAEGQEIKSEDYKSTWDEFGIHALVDGAESPNQITQQMTRDIVQATQTEQSYDQQETNYLQEIQSTPEEIQAVEGPAGSDVSSSEPIDPNPSLEMNPNVSALPIEETGSGQATSTEQDITLPIEASSSSPSIDSAPVDSVSDATSSETDVFNAILQGEQAANEPIALPTEPAPVNEPAAPPLEPAPAE